MGEQVADHVVRRYATPAARDADLAVITAAHLQGQVVAILADGTFPPYLMMHNGTNWEVVAASAPHHGRSPGEVGRDVDLYRADGWHGSNLARRDGIQRANFHDPAGGALHARAVYPVAPERKCGALSGGAMDQRRGVRADAWTGAMAYGMQFFGNDIQPLNAGDTVGLYMWHSGRAAKTAPAWC